MIVFNFCKENLKTPVETFLSTVVFAVNCNKAAPSFIVFNLIEETVASQSVFCMNYLADLFEHLTSKLFHVTVVWQCEINLQKPHDNVFF